MIYSDPHFTVIGECSIEKAIEKAKLLRPNVFLMDINLSGMYGIEATEQILKIAPQINTKKIGAAVSTQKNRTV